MEDQAHPGGVEDQAQPGGAAYREGQDVRSGPGAAQDRTRDEVLVVGVGNDLRGDDGAGRAVVEELVRRAVPGIRAIWSHQLVPELTEQIATAELVVFVDAGHPGTVPGVEVCRLLAGAPALGAHQAGPAGLLGLAALAGLAVPDAYLVTVPAHDLGLGTGLSPGTAAAVSEAADAVIRLARDPARVPGADGA